MTEFTIVMRRGWVFFSLVVVIVCLIILLKPHNGLYFVISMELTGHCVCLKPFHRVFWLCPHQNSMCIESPALYEFIVWLIFTMKSCSTLNKFIVCCLAYTCNHIFHLYSRDCSRLYCKCI